jgi:hypothetical protein
MGSNVGRTAKYEEGERLLEMSKKRKRKKIVFSIRWEVRGGQQEICPRRGRDVIMIMFFWNWG